MKVILIGSSKSDCVIKASKYLAEKYMRHVCKVYLYYDDDLDGWSKYLIGFLSYLTDEKVILGLDDFLIADYVSIQELHEAEYMVEGDVVCVKLCKTTNEEHEQYPITCQFAIWNREFLIRMLRHTNSPWNFERRGSQIFEKKTLVRTCIDYNCNSATSFRWEGADLTGLKEEDYNYIIETLLPLNMMYRTDKGTGMRGDTKLGSE